MDYWFNLVEVSVLSIKPLDSGEEEEYTFKEEPKKSFSDFKF